MTQYEARYENICVYPYPAYTDEMGAAHGNFTLTRDEIRGVLEDSIDTQFLVLE